MIREVLTQVKNVFAAHKKKFLCAVILVLLLGAFSAGVHSMFEVKGIVKSVDNNSVTVANFLRMQTVDVTGALNTSVIKVGDRVKIQKNWQGDVLYVRILNDRKDGHRHKDQRHHTDD